MRCLTKGGNLWVSLALLQLVSVSTMASANEQECIVSDDGSSTCSNSGEEQAPLECGIYMAPSTLGDFTNMGMFTANNVSKGHVLEYPEIAIPLLFRDWDIHPERAFGDGQLWERYIWEGEVADLEVMDNLRRYVRPSVFVPGLGCTVNSVLELNNIKSTTGSIYDTVNVPRSHPATGSFTPYHQAITRAVREIPAGSELFASYGDAWIPWIPDVAVTKNEYLNEANEFLKEYQQFVKKLQKDHGKEQVDDALLERLWKLTQGFPLKSRPFSVLPRDWDYVSRHLKEEQEMDSRDYWRSKGVVSVEWLQQHGKCQDHMKPGASTLPNVGYGAFATRSLPKGSVVGYAPLVHIGERVEESLTIDYNGTTTSYGGSKSTSSSKEPGEKYSKLDLVINYSFGHRDSSLIVTPYGAMVNYINHSKEKANVRIQWPTKELVAHKPDWLQHSVETLRDTNTKIGLSFDYVALRDIQEGEEIFMDYGDEWQAAWDEHVKNWKAPKDAHRYVHSSKYKEDNKKQPLKTPAERLAHPYPPNLQTLCQESYRKDLVTKKFVFIPVLRLDDSRVECEVVERHVKENTKGSGTKFVYTVMMKTKDDPGNPIKVYDVPHGEGIELHDKVYSQDWHLPEAFRHKMFIPDDMFPEAWRNLKK